MKGSDDGFSIFFTVTNDKVRPLAGGQVVVFYDAPPLNGVNRRSKRVTLSVIGQLVELALPLVEYAAGGALDPADIPDEDGHVEVEIAAWAVMAAGDHLRLVWNGTDETGVPDSYDDSRDISRNMVGLPVRFSVPKSKVTVLAGGRLVVYYTILTNARALLESPRLELTISGGIGSLPAPSVEGAENDVLDPAQYPNGTNAVVGAYTDKAIGDEVTLYWDGSLGSTSDTLPVNSSNLNRDLKLWIDGQYISGNANAVVQVRYEVTRVGGGTENSRRLELRIGQALGDDLPAPEVLEADGNELDPLAALEGATVRVSYPGMQAVDTIAVSWTGTDGPGTIVTEQQPGSAGGSVDFAIPASVVGANVGKPVRVLYAVVRGGADAVLSDVLELTVKEIAESSLPTPVVPQASANVLDLNSFTGDARVTVVPWPLIAVGQRVWLRCVGTNANGNAQTITLLTAHSITAGQVTAGLNVSIPRDQLATLKDDSALRVELLVSVEGSSSESAAKLLPSLNLTVAAEQLGTLVFVNGPYEIAPLGRVKPIELVLTSDGSSPAPNVQVTLTLPTGFTYADGGTGNRNFTTDAGGKVTVRGVKGSRTVGNYTLSASGQGLTATAAATVVALGAVGTIAADFVTGLAVSPDGRRLYTVSGSNSACRVFDTATYASIGTINLPGNSFRIVTSPDGDRAYCGAGGDVAVIDTERLTVLTTIAVEGAREMALSFDGRWLYASNNSTLSVIDVPDNRVLKTISLRDMRNVVFHPHGQWAYAALPFTSRIAIIDTTTHEVTGHIENVYGALHGAVSIDSMGSYLYTSSSGGVHKYDLSNNQRVATIVESFTGQLVFSGQWAYVGANENQISVIDTVSNSVVQRVDTLGGTWNLAISPDGRRIYKGANGGGPISIIAGR